MQQLAQKIVQITTLPVQQLEKEIANLDSFPETMKVLGDLLTAQFSEEQKMKAAVIINKIIEKKLGGREDNEEILKECWMLYAQNVLNHQQVDKIQWRFIRATASTLQSIMEQFEQSLTHEIALNYSQFPSLSKLLIIETFLYVQTTNNTKYTFIRQTFQDYFQTIKIFVKNIHNKEEYRVEDHNFIVQVLETLEKMFENMAEYELDQKFNQMFKKICLNRDLFELITEIMWYDIGKKCLIGELDKVASIVIISQKYQCINNQKACAVELLCELLKRYDYTSNINDFDALSVLSFSEKLLPIVLSTLYENIPLYLKYYSQLEQIFKALLSFLRIMFNFSFMSETLEKQFENILFRIVFQLMNCGEKEKQDFNTGNESDFIGLAEEIVEIPSYCEYDLKKYCAMLLQMIAEKGNNAIPFIVDLCKKQIISQLTRKEDNDLIKFKQTNPYELTIEGAFSVLSVLSLQLKKRNTELQIIRDQILDCELLMKVQGLTRSRLFIFLAFYYDMIYCEQPGRGEKFLGLANDCLGNSKVEASCGLLLFQNCLELGFGEKIWVALLEKIPISSQPELFRIIKTIIKKTLLKMPCQYIKDLLKKIISRLIAEYQKQDINIIEDGRKIQGSEILYKILHIIQQISENVEYLRQQKQVEGALWPVFDLIQFSDIIEFEDDILTIFNNILKADLPITPKYFEPIRHFQKIYLRNKFYPALRKTFTLLLSHGHGYFLSGPQGRQNLQDLTDTLISFYGSNSIISEETLKFILIFLHYIYLNFGKIIQPSHEFKAKLMDIYENNKDLKQQTKAALINFVIIGQIFYGGYNLSIVGQNQIKIFKGYQGLMFAMGMRLIIEKIYQVQDVTIYVKYCIRLLHYVRENISSQSRSSYFYPQFIEYAELDPFNEVCKSLDFLKKRLDKKVYDELIEEVSKEISLGEVKDLLSRRVVDNKMRTFMKIKS